MDHSKHQTAVPQKSKSLIWDLDPLDVDYSYSCSQEELQEFIYLIMIIKSISNIGRPAAFSTKCTGLMYFSQIKMASAQGQ